MDVNSGSVHIVDDVVYDVLPYLEKKESKEEILKALANSYAPAEIEEALEECHELEEAGALFTLLTTVTSPVVTALQKKVSIMAVVP